MVESQIQLGAAFTELHLMLYGVSRYEAWKNQYVAWKKLLVALSVSPMTPQWAVENMFYKVFDQGGLFDKGLEFVKNEQ